MDDLEMSILSFIGGVGFGVLAMYLVLGVKFFRDAVSKARKGK